MKRRAFTAGLGGAAAWPLVAQAQQAAMPVIGYLGLTSAEADAYLLAPFRKGLSEAGFDEGRNVTIDCLFAERDINRLPALATELIRRDVTVVLTGTTISTFAIKAATSTIPIVFAIGSDPVNLGLVESFSRPGGNLTGVTFFSTQIEAKRLGVLREFAPKADLIGVLLNANDPALYNPGNPSNLKFLEDLRVHAGDMAITVTPVELRSPKDLNVAFAAITAQRPDALQVLGDSGTLDISDRIAAFALAQHLPSLSTLTAYAEFGGLLAYGLPRRRFLAKSGYYVKRILDGANPGDLPVEQPTQIELWINLKTAKALGVTVPPTLLARADEVIE